MPRLILTLIFRPYAIPDRSEEGAEISDRENCDGSAADHAEKRIRHADKISALRNEGVNPTVKPQKLQRKVTELAHRRGDLTNGKCQ